MGFYAFYKAFNIAQLYNKWKGSDVSLKVRRNPMDNGASSYRRFLNGDESAFDEIMKELFYIITFKKRKNLFILTKMVLIS